VLDKNDPLKVKSLMKQIVNHHETFTNVLGTSCSQILNDEIFSAVENFKNNEIWTIDSKYSCIAAAVALKTKTPKEWEFFFPSDQEVDLPSRCLVEIFRHSGKTFASIKFGDFMLGKKETMARQSTLFHLIKQHRYVAVNMILVLLFSYTLH